jgi:pimeloyl-ACP methyl ester carboxylesterase
MLLSVQKEFPTNWTGDSTRPDLVMIHGTGANAEMWRPQVDLLVARGYRCFLPEFRGHGQSDEPGETTGIEEHVLDVMQSIENQGIRFPAIFIGHSLGAIVSMTIAERRPDLFASVLAVGMPGRVLPPMAMAFRWFLHGVYHRVKGTELHRRLPWRERTLIGTEFHSLQQIVHHFTDINYVDKDFDIKCPVHFSVGRFDPVAPAHFVVQMHKKMPGSSLQIFEWAGHNCMDERPQEFNAWMLEKLALNASIAV